MQHNKSISLIGVFILCFLSISGILAQQRIYQASMETAIWVTEENIPLTCRISQILPYYGKGEFIQQAGETIYFSLYTKKSLFQKGKAYLYARNPIWRRDNTDLDLGTVNILQGHTPITVEGDRAARLLQELENGMMPVIHYADQADGRDDILVQLLPINFNPAYNSFLSCQTQLLAYGYKQVQNSKVYFDTDKSVLTDAAKAVLKKISHYLSVDKNIQQVLITGHADNRGTHKYNDKLSQQRALVVRQFFIDEGVENNRLALAFFGKRKPAEDNSTAWGQQQNRRVQIELFKAKSDLGTVITE